MAANAFEGRGGNITINARAAFISPDSPVSASSELGIDGTVEIDAPDNLLQSALNPLSVELVVPARLVEGSCLGSSRKLPTFTNAGTGGLPTSPETQTETFIPDPPSLEATSQRAIAIGVAQREFAPWQPGMPIIPANRIVQLPDGRIASVTEVKVTPAQLEDLLCQ